MFPSRMRSALTEKHVRVDLIEAVIGADPAHGFAIGEARHIFRRPGAADRHREIFRLKPRPSKGPALDDVDLQGDGGALVDRHPGQFDVSLCGVAIADVAQAAADVHRKGKDRAKHQQIYSNVGRRTTVLHPILSFGRQIFWKTNENSHPRPEKAPNGINAAAINLSHRLTLPSLHRTTKVGGRHSGVIGCVRPFRYAHVSISSDCVLTSPDLSMRCRHLFYARSSTKDAQCLSMEQRDKPAFLQCDNFLDRAIASCDKAVHPEADRP